MDTNILAKQLSRERLIRILGTTGFRIHCQWNLENFIVLFYLKINTITLIERGLALS